jgi:hypothetical protein
LKPSGRLERSCSNARRSSVDRLAMDAGSVATAGSRGKALLRTGFGEEVIGELRRGETAAAAL